MLALLVFIFLLLSSNSINGETDPSDAAALVDMYENLNSSGQLTYWSSNGADPCLDDWKGVTCSGSRVTEIKLSNLGLSGAIGSQLSSLTSIIYFDVSNNNFSNQAQIPYSLPPNVEILNLAGCGYSGSLPYSISQMASLKYLNVAYNQFSGRLTDMFGNLSSLNTLDLSYNSFTGDLPNSFSLLSSATNIYLQNNEFTGSIDVLATLPLKTLDVSNNKFTGWVPSQFMKINFLTIGNSWNSELAPPPPQGTPATKGGGQTRQPGGGKKSVVSGGAVAGIVISISIVSAFIVFIVLKRIPVPVLVTGIIRKFKKGINTKNYANVENFLKNHEFLAKRYSYLQVKKMTNTFKVKLGQGGFGSVYRGALSNGDLVAVKVLSGLKGNGEDFINEVASVGKTSHVNIVSLVGFCFEGPKRALIYEFMPNGSLEKFIHNQTSTNNSQLGWKRLHDIAIGIGRGLEYLHIGCNTRILHFDIKPHNILLDQDFSPKISDFGLAKLFPEKRSMISMSHMRGTPGYIAPEVYSRNFGQVSHKSDVYSYGMMILEMVGGRKNIEAGVDHTSEIYFPDWIYKKFELDEELGLRTSTNDEEHEMVRKMIIVGLWCIQTNPFNRPTISKVLEMLEGDLASLEIPPKPYLSSPPRTAGSSFTD